jgi:hypothetical protein
MCGGGRAQFDQPHGVVATADGGVLYVADLGNNCIRRISCATRPSGVCCCVCAVHVGPDFSLTSMRPDQWRVWWFAVELRIVYQGRNVSQKQFVTTYAGRQKRVAPSSVVPAVVAAFFGPMSLALSPDGARFEHGCRADCCHIAPLTKVAHHRADVRAEKRLFVMEAQGRRVRMIVTSGALRS